MPPNFRRQSKVARLVTNLGAAALFVALLNLAPTSANFAAVTDNPANAFASDTLDPPTGLGATDGLNVTLDWTATVDSYATGYRIFRSTTSGGPYSQISDLSPNTVVTDTDGPAPGTYYYVARSYSGTWESANSNETAGVVWQPFDCPADPNLRACIRFDTDAAGTYADYSGNSNTVIHSNGSQTAGVSGNAIVGSATAQYAITDSPSLDITSAITMEMWAKFDSVPSSGRAGLIDNDGQYSVIYYGGTGLQCSNGPDQLPHVAVPIGVWVHIACTWDGATLSLYLDGTPAGTMPSVGMAATTNTNPISLADTSPAFAEPLDGSMDNVRIWAAGRTQAQICTDAGLTC